jgi:hypothetical protein
MALQNEWEDELIGDCLEPANNLRGIFKNNGEANSLYIIEEPDGFRIILWWDSNSNDAVMKSPLKTQFNPGKYGEEIQYFSQVFPSLEAAKLGYHMILSIAGLT